MYINRCLTTRSRNTVKYFIKYRLKSEKKFLTKNLIGARIKSTSLKQAVKKDQTLTNQEDSSLRNLGNKDQINFKIKLLIFLNIYFFNFFYYFYYKLFYQKKRKKNNYHKYTKSKHKKRFKKVN